MEKVLKPSERIREILMERKKIDPADGEEIDLLFGRESTLSKAIIQYLDEIKSN